MTEFLQGWRGIAWEPAVRCVYCGEIFSAFDGPTLREIKREHRETCTPEPVSSEAESPPGRAG